MIVVDKQLARLDARKLSTKRAELPCRVCCTCSAEAGPQPALNTGSPRPAARSSSRPTMCAGAEDWLQSAAAGMNGVQLTTSAGACSPSGRGPRPSWLPNVVESSGRSSRCSTTVTSRSSRRARCPRCEWRSAGKRSRGHGGLRSGSGRKAGTLLGQEVREWCIRARKAGSGLLRAGDAGAAPSFPAERLNKSYFRVVLLARHQPGTSLPALRPRLEAPERTTLDFAQSRNGLGVPRYLYRKAATAAIERVLATSQT